MIRGQVRLAAAWSLLGVCRLLIAALPFVTIRRLLGENRGAAAHRATRGSPAHLDVSQLQRAHRIGQVVQRAARHTPWTSDCYPQALTARTFLALRRIPHTVEFGVRRHHGTLLAHVWVRAGDVAVTGGDGAGWTGVGTFTWPPTRVAP